MKVKQIPYISLHMNFHRPESGIKNLYVEEYKNLNVVDRTDNGMDTNNLVDLVSKKYVPQMNDRIYFMKGVTVPRIKLKDLALKFKVRTTTDIDNATVVVGSSTASGKLVKNDWYYKISKSVFCAFLNYAIKTIPERDYNHSNLTTHLGYLKNFIDDKDLEYFYTDWSTARTLRNKDGVFDTETTKDLYEILNKEWEKINDRKIKHVSSNFVWHIDDSNLSFLNNIGDKQIIEQNCILEYVNGDDCTTIDKDTYVNLRSMLSSSDTDNHVLAMEIMANCNYKESLLYLYLLFQKHYDGTMYHVRSKHHVNFKSLKSYLGISSQYHDHPDTTFRHLKKHNVLTPEFIDVIMEENIEYFNNNGFSEYIKPLNYTLTEQSSEELKFDWTNDRKKEIPVTGVEEKEITNETIVDVIEEKIENKPTIDELKNSEPDTAETGSQEDPKIEEVLITKKEEVKNEETTNSGFDWF